MSRIQELGAPDSEFNETFVEGMRKRMAVSYHKYGFMKDAAAAGVDQPASLVVRLQRYLDTGNTEWLMDVANMAMIEFSHPCHPEAHYRPTDSDESPGRVMPNKPNVMGGVTRGGMSAKHNKDVA